MQNSILFALNWFAQFPLSLCSHFHNRFRRVFFFFFAISREKKWKNKSHTKTHSTSFIFAFKFRIAYVTIFSIRIFYLLPYFSIVLEPFAVHRIIRWLTHCCCCWLCLPFICAWWQIVKVSQAQCNKII